MPVFLVNSQVQVFLSN